MRILMVVTGMSMGGAERLVRDLADAVPAEVRIAYLKGPLEVQPRHSEVGLHCLGLESARDALPSALRFVRLVREFRPDIVHAHMFHAALLTRLVRPALPRLRLISTMHTSYDGGRLRALAFRATDWLSDLSTNVSNEAIDTYAEHGAVARDRMVPIYNGIDVHRFQPVPGARQRIREEFGVPEDCKLLLAVGRLNWSKDYPNLFQTLARLDPSFRYRLLVAGEGPHRASLERMVEDMGLSPHVRFLGIRRDVPTLMSAADVFVLSSVKESFGLVVAEAMACECVVVATDAGGIREVMGPDPFLVPVKDPDALARAIHAACALDGAQMAAHGRTARRRIVEQFSFERMVSAWMEAYQRLLAGPLAGTPGRRLLD